MYSIRAFLSLIAFASVTKIISETSFMRNYAEEGNNSSLPFVERLTNYLVKSEMLKILLQDYREKLVEIFDKFIGKEMKKLETLLFYNEI